jgi:hypothetical protein
MVSDQIKVEKHLTTHPKSCGFNLVSDGLARSRVKSENKARQLTA